jgi:hypothetical protein
MLPPGPKAVAREMDAPPAAIYTRLFGRRLLQNVARQKRLRTLPCRVVIATERQQTVEHHLPQADVDDFHPGPLHERAHLVDAADENIGRASLARFGSKRVRRA